MLTQLLSLSVCLVSIIQGHAFADGAAIRTSPRHSTQAYGISSDGSTVVGVANGTGGDEAFRWTSEDGLHGLGYLPGATGKSVAFGSSGDGSVVVGYGYSALGVEEAFVWSPASGMVGLGDLSGGDVYSEAAAVSADGNTVVGTSSSTLGFEPFVWSAEDGMVGLGFPGWSKGISADGVTVVGHYNGHAFKWTAATGKQFLGDLGGSQNHSIGWAASQNGDVVVGYSYSPFGMEAFRWTQATGMVGLGDLSGGSFKSYAMGVSADGSVIVGYSDAGPSVGQEAFIWDAQHGMRPLRDVLEDEHGLDCSQFGLDYVRGVSSDGTTICGTGPDAWVAVIPEPATLSLLALGALALVRRRKHGSIK